MNKNEKGENLFQKLVASGFSTETSEEYQKYCEERIQEENKKHYEEHIRRDSDRHSEAIKAMGYDVPFGLM